MMDRRLIEGGMEEREQVCGADCGGRAGSTAAGDRRAKPEELTLADFPARFHFSNASLKGGTSKCGKVSGLRHRPSDFVCRKTKRKSVLNFFFRNKV
jgi:hypothetical protein